MRFWKYLPAFLLLAVATANALRASDEMPDSPAGGLEFLGEVTFPTGFEFSGTTVGGLSALTYDPKQNLFYALSDDPARRGPARLYSLRIDLGDASLDEGDVAFHEVIPLLDTDGTPYAEYALDGEGLARTPNGFFVSSEGNISRGVMPFLREFTGDGTFVRKVSIRRRFRPRKQGRKGLRHNLAFESLTLSPDRRRLYTANENALGQDGPTADLGVGSPVRIVRYNAGTGKSEAEYLYWVDPVTQAPAEADGFRTNGLVELLSLGADRLLALERQYSAGVGNSVQIYLVDLASAQPLGCRALRKNAESRRAAKKSLLFDLDKLGLTLDNLEGMTFGPPLADGRRSLLLVSDNNFNNAQRTQFLAFAWGSASATIEQLQGQGHRSRWAGSRVEAVEGVVTAAISNRSGHGFWMQGPTDDGESATSGGLFVSVTEPSPLPDVGDRVGVTGLVAELSRPRALPRTVLEAESWQLLASDVGTPYPIRLGESGIQIPSAHIDNDGLSRFDPSDDAIDRFESLEGMLVAVDRSRVVGPTNRYGELVVVPQGRTAHRNRTSRGGVRLAEGDSNPERLILDSSLIGQMPAAAVGTLLASPIVGIVDYNFGSYRLRLTRELSVAVPAQPERESTGLRPSDEQVTIATYNVENLDPGDGDIRFADLAKTIVENIGSPDILALQEIQDDSGPEDNGAVSAQGTFQLLVDAVATAGGPTYDYYQLDPQDGEDGGQPGANIRVGYLVNPARVSVPALPDNPQRLGVNDAAFNADAQTGYEPSRKPLALEVDTRFGRLLVVNAHLRSKRADTGLFGAAQPPVRYSEQQRVAQAQLVHDFVAERLAVEPQAAVVVLGDLNEHEFRPALQTLAGLKLENLAERVEAADRYTFNYRGNSQLLDHALVSPVLSQPGMAAIDIVHINADFPASARTSDHDPLVVGLRKWSD